MATSDKLNRLLQTKIDLKNAINEKGGSITDKTVFSDYANAVRNLKNGSSDLIDVSELPSTVDDSKIYRQKGATYATCYIAIDQDGVLAVYEIGQALSLTSGESIFINYEVVDKLPATGNVFGENDYTVYVVKNTAIGYVYNNAWYDLATFASTVAQGSFENKGEIESIANITEVGIYTIYAQKTVIGIPNSNNNRQAVFWSGTKWATNANYVVIGEGNLPDIGVEGTIYFRNNIPYLWMKQQGIPLIDVLGAFGNGRFVDKSIILNDTPTSIEAPSDLLFPIGYLKTENGYKVFAGGVFEGLEIENDDITYEIKFRDEIWYFRNNKYVKISQTNTVGKFSDIVEIGDEGTYYTGDLFAVKVTLPNKRFIVKGVSGDLKANDFVYDEFDNFKTVRIGALAGCTGVTSIEKFTINNATIGNTNPLYGKNIIGDASFYGCTGLTIFDIEAYGGIGKHAFYGCTNLQTVHIYSPNIGEYAFANCTSLTDIHFNGTKAGWNAGTFGRGWNENTGNYTVHCTDGNINK